MRVLLVVALASAFAFGAENEEQSAILSTLANKEIKVSVLAMSTALPPTPSPPSGKPDTCDSSYDAVSVIRREMFIFKNKYMWRLKEERMMEGYPAPITQLWRDLPSNFTHVDAVYERVDKKIVFFIGREMYLFDGNRLEQGYPKSLVSLGLPPEVDHIDAAMVWGYNSKTYFFSGNIYWRLDEDEHQVELDYPREITTMWKGMGSHFDAVFVWNDGKTYFFKGKGFWKLNDPQMRAENEHPIHSAAFWMNCTNYDLVDNVSVLAMSTALPPAPSPPSGKPDICDSSYDAVSVIRREMFIFKNKYMWRLKEERMMEGYPAPITQLWRDLPSNFTHVDAVYERVDKKIVFFIGREMYLFDGIRLEKGYPKSLVSLGLPPEVDHIDAAMVWGYNSKTYFFSGNIYWRFDEDEHHIELDYPREITTMWKGMGSHFDAVFVWNDGKTYFFKGKGFWKLNDPQMRAENEHPIHSAAFWMNCTNHDLVDDGKKREKEEKVLLLAPHS